MSRVIVVVDLSKQPNRLDPARRVIVVVIVTRQYTSRQAAVVQLAACTPMDIVPLNILKVFFPGFCNDGLSMWLSNFYLFSNETVQQFFRKASKKNDRKTERSKSLRKKKVQDREIDVWMTCEVPS